MSTDEARAARAAERTARIVLRKATLTATEHDLDPTSGAAAISLAMQLSIESWRWAGFEMPSYARPATPIRFVPRVGR